MRRSTGPIVSSSSNMVTSKNNFATNSDKNIVQGVTRVHDSNVGIAFYIILS